MRELKKQESFLTPVSHINLKYLKFNKLIINLTIIDDERFVLIMWMNDKYNTISMNDIQKFDTYMLEQVVKCRFGNGKHPGTIKCIGTETECENKLTQILEYITDDTLKKTISKKPTGRILAASTSENQDKCKQEQLEAENKDLHRKLLSKIA